MKTKTTNATPIPIKNNPKNANKKFHSFGAKVRRVSRTVSSLFANTPNTNLPIIARLTIDFVVQKANNNNQTGINNKKLELLARSSTKIIGMGMIAKNGNKNHKVALIATPQ
ncbi:hypothetical protein CYANOKiyG1_04750 [Okeania sp. KiyG1]|nr:hypothetical protein CYANOKiyG1_04750 [Okeania sp. KiyG1]